MFTHHCILSRNTLNINISGRYLANVLYLKNLVFTQFYISQRRLRIFITDGTILACNSSMCIYFRAVQVQSVAVLLEFAYFIMTDYPLDVLHSAYKK